MLEPDECSSYLMAARKSEKALPYLLVRETRVLSALVTAFFKLE